MRGIIAIILSTVICLAALAAWLYTVPAEGSGWILFVALLGTHGLLKSIRKVGLATAVGLIITAVFGATWWFHRGLENSGWILFLCILCALDTFNNLRAMVSAETKIKK